MSTPYIGVNDFMTRQQIEHMLKVWEKYKQSGVNRRLHVGVMMTHKTLHAIPCRLTDAVPKKEEIGDILYHLTSDSMRCVHYADYRQGYSIQADLEDAIYFGGSGMNAIQLDMIWPDEKAIAGAICESVRNNLEVILQVGKDAFREVNENPHELVRKLRSYEGVVSHVLLDLSMGTGQELNPRFLEPFIEQIYWQLPWLDVVVAGGLGPGRLDPIKDLVRRYPKLSFDAQTWLRPSGNILDPVDWQMAEAYVIEALEMVTG